MSRKVLRVEADLGFAILVLDSDVRIMHNMVDEFELDVSMAP
jgi:hypothetical protein